MKCGNINFWEAEGSQAHPQRAKPYPNQPSSFRHIHDPALAEDLVIRTLVIRLSRAVSPGAIFWRVVSATIFALQCHAGRTFSHVCQKVFKLLPLFANSDTNVVFVLRMRGPQSIPHRFPGSICWRCPSFASFSSTVPMSGSAHSWIESNPPQIVKEVLP